MTTDRRGTGTRGGSGRRTRLGRALGAVALWATLAAVAFTVSSQQAPSAWAIPKGSDRPARPRLDDRSRPAMSARPDSVGPLSTPGPVAGAGLGDDPVIPKIPARVHARHEQHAAAGVGCVTCHAGVVDATSADVELRPTGATCDGCHHSVHAGRAGSPYGRAAGKAASDAGAAPAPACSLCHRGVVQDDHGVQRVVGLGPRATPALQFNHAAHLRRGVAAAADVGGRHDLEAACAGCHATASAPAASTAVSTPMDPRGPTAQVPEATCRGCHDTLPEASSCDTCHPSDASGRLTTARRFGARVVARLIPRGRQDPGLTHTASFTQDHAAIARARAEDCARCHEASSCQACHDGDVRPLRIHAVDYVNAHALDSRARALECASCHREQTFCRGCHERVGAAPNTGGHIVGGAAVIHPDGWSAPSGAAQGHAAAAQRNLASCVSCHSEDSCLACHATRAAAIPGLGASPHGGHFKDSAKCLALAQRSRQACLACHAPTQPELDCL